jgi:hypothetical protein
MATSAQDALLGQDCSVTVTCDDPNVHTGAVTQDVTEVIITPAITSTQKHNVGDDLRHEQQTDEEYTVELRGESVADYNSLHFAAMASAARRGNRTTPTYTITVVANGGPKGAWTVTVKFCRYQSGPLTITQNNAPVTTNVSWRGYELDFHPG